MAVCQNVPTVIWKWRIFLWGVRLPHFDELHSLQVVWFVAGDVSALLDEVFEAVVGEQPDQVQRLKPPASPFPVVIASSQGDGRSHRLQFSPGRVDFVLMPHDGVVSAEAPRFANFAVIDELVDRVKQATRLIGPSFRQSIVAKAAKRMSSESDVGPAFAEFLGLSGDFESTTDLSFSVNRRTHREGVNINRMLRWSGETTSVHQIGFEHAPAAMLGPTHYLSYIADINTVPVPVARPHSEQLTIFDTLRDVVFEVLSYRHAKDFQ